MTTTHFQGPLEIGLAPAAVSRPMEIIAVPLAVAAAASTDITVPVPNCRIISLRERTVAPFTGTTVTLQLGTSVGGAQIAAPIDIKAVAAERVVPLVDAAAMALDTVVAGNLFVRLAQTGPTAVGNGVLLIGIQRTGDA